MSKTPAPNVLVAQSGGPSPVINASLAGLVEGCRAFSGRFGRIFAARHGIEGVLTEDWIVLDAQPSEELARLRYTPAAGAIGTCRYKLNLGQEEDFDRILEVCQAHRVGFFFYIGGNDSMDTAAKIDGLARARGLELVVAGIPKTIDNDLGDEAFELIDHTPGYGSAARYWALTIQNVEEENRGMSPSECVSVLQAMGRTAGFIPAAARLADPDRRYPLQIYTAESGHTLESMADHVNRELRRCGRCIVVVSEGFNVGDLGEAHDGFGHIEYGASRTTVAQVVCNYLNRVRLAARGYATHQVPGVLQRCVSVLASCVDQAEAFEVGRFAAEMALGSGSGWMATILRKPGERYAVRYDKVPLERMAAITRHLPRHWLSPDRTDVTDDFVRYAQPLLGEEWPEIPLEKGLQRFARLLPLRVEKRCPPYVPVRLRQTGPGGPSVPTP